LDFKEQPRLGIFMPGLFYLHSMDEIPMDFECNGKKYSCHFTRVHDAGQHAWHLSDERNHYLGRLRKDVDDKWVFDPTHKTQELSGLADFFGDYLTADLE